MTICVSIASQKWNITANYSFYVHNGPIFSKEGWPWKNPRNHRTPQDVQQLQSFLGMINFVQLYIPHLSNHIVSLRELLKKNQVFYWNDNTNTTFQMLKTFMSKALSTHPAVLQVRSSHHHLGTCQKAWPWCILTSTWQAYNPHLKSPWQMLRSRMPTLNGSC